MNSRNPFVIFLWTFIGVMIVLGVMLSASLVGDLFTLGVPQ